MLGPLGPAEIIFIVVLALLIFGPRRLPEVGRTVGKAMGEFRRATTELKRSVNTELALEEEAAARPGPGGPARSGDRRREPESWQPRDPAPAGPEVSGTGGAAGRLRPAPGSEPVGGRGAEPAAASATGPVAPPAAAGSTVLDETGDDSSEGEPPGGAGAAGADLGGTSAGDSRRGTETP